MADLSRRPEVTGWVGWVYYAGFMMVLVGILQAMSGLAALVNSNFLVAGPNNVWLVNVTTWGWLHLLLGIIVTFAGYAVMSGKTWGRVLGVWMAGVSAIANFNFIPIYPFWAITLLVIDLLVIYALIAHGSEAREV